MLVCHLLIPRAILLIFPCTFRSFFLQRDMSFSTKTREKNQTRDLRFSYQRSLDSANLPKLYLRLHLFLLRLHISMFLRSCMLDSNCVESALTMQLLNYHIVFLLVQHLRTAYTRQLRAPGLDRKIVR